MHLSINSTCWQNAKPDPAGEAESQIQDYQEDNARTCINLSGMFILFGHDSCCCGQKVGL